MAAERTYTVTGMDCASCAATLEGGIKRLDGVEGVRIDFMGGKIHLTGSATLDDLRARAHALGHYDIIDEQAAPTEGDGTPAERPTGVLGFVRYLLHERPTQFALAGGSVALLTLLAALMGLSPNIATVGYVVGTAIAGYPVARSGINNLWYNRSFNLNLLMTIAAGGAVVIGEPLEASVVVFLYALGEALEGFTAERARQSIRALADLAPAHAHRLTGDQTETVPVAALAVGDAILVKPGERLPMDGEVIAGQSAVNQAPITGESVPVHKGIGSEVFAGTINGDGALTVRVTKRAEDNTMSHIIKLVEEAQSVQSPAQRRVDQFAAYYTPIMALAALLVAVVPPVAFGAPFFEPATGGHGWLYRALAMLMIACPCSLVISTPVTVVSAITHAARRGVLIKGGLHLETLGRARAFAFDKTGTLTYGEPRVVGFTSFQHDDAHTAAPRRDLVTLAAAVEAHSSHPLARAFAGEQNGHRATDVTELKGRGVRGQVDGHTITVGSHRYFDETFPHDDVICEQVRQGEARGWTVLMVAQDDEIRGIVGVADTVREDSRAVIDDLNALGVRTIMLTGDNATVAQVVGEAVGVTDVRAELLPADKATAVTGLREQFGTVAMVGDGVNDAPALATATVGIAMGGAGSAQAIETADIALMQDDLRQLPFTVRLSRFAVRLIEQNIALSVGVKLVFSVLAVAGLTSLWAAIFADVGMLVLVTLNGMRPLRFR